MFTLLTGKSLGRSLLVALLSLPALAASASTLQNPGFESGSLSGWIYSAVHVQYSATNARTGTGCVEFTGGGTALQTMSGLNPNTTYRFSGYGKLASTPTTGWIGVTPTGGTATFQAITSTTAYQKIDIIFTTGPATTSVQVWIGVGGTVGHLYGDDFSFSPLYVPASDKFGTQGWVTNATYSDEFDGTTLDTAKWNQRMTYWIGRFPSQYDPNNVTVSGGKLHLRTINNNILVNGNFERNVLAPWVSDAGNAMITTLSSTNTDAILNYHAARLPSAGSITQTLTGLQPNTTYRLQGFMKVSATGVVAKLGVRNHGAAEQSVVTSGLAWNSNAVSTLDFTTGASATSATIFVTNSGTPGAIYVDEVSVVRAVLPSGWGQWAGNYFTAASIQSKTSAPYGYYEAKIKMADEVHCGAFWLQYFTGSNAGVEIDVCELIGESLYYPTYETAMPMATHIFTPSGTLSTGDIHQVGNRSADDFHIYGVDWNASTITYYYDGDAVRSIANPGININQWVILDTEVFTNHGVPEVCDSDFQVEYVRAWTK